MENCSTVFISIFLDRNGSESQTAGSENGSGINGNTKTGKYDRKIDKMNSKRELKLGLHTAYDRSNTPNRPHINIGTILNLSISLIKDKPH
jgi:hypothetical protein